MLIYSATTSNPETLNAEMFDFWDAEKVWILDQVDDAFTWAEEDLETAREYDYPPEEVDRLERKRDELQSLLWDVIAAQRNGYPSQDLLDWLDSLGYLG